MKNVFSLVIISMAVYSCNPKAPVKKVEGVNFSSVKDICKNTYRAIQIGSQTWMVDNLKTIRYSDELYDTYGVKIKDSIRTLVPSDSSILYRPIYFPGGTIVNNDTLSYYWKYQGGVSKNDFGKLYTWYTLKNRNVCPSGWHVPTEYEWEKLITYLGGEEIAGGKLKSTDTTMWENPNVGATNSSNFNAIGGGYKTEFASFINQLKFGMYWSSTEDPTFPDCAIAYAFYAGSIKSYKVSKSKKAALSVRCIAGK